VTLYWAVFRGAASAAVAPAGAMAGGETAGRSVVSRKIFIAIVIALIVFVVVAILLAVALATILLVLPFNQSSSGTNTLSSWMTTETAGTAGTVTVSQRCPVFQIHVHEIRI